MLYDVASRCRKSAGKGITLTATFLDNDPDIRPQSAGRRESIIHRTAIDHYNLMQPLGQAGKYMGQVAGFVEGRSDHRYLWRRTGSGTGKTKGVRNICCKACWCAASAAAGGSIWWRE